MDRINLIAEAIEKADRLESAHGESTYNVPALSSLRLRHLMNNLGAIGTKYLECGPHRGGLFCATIKGNVNLKTATAVDSFESDMDAIEPAKPDFLLNASTHGNDATKFKLIEGDCFQIDLKEIPKPIDLFLYDAGHSEDDQRKAITYYLPVLADEFILCVDDYDWADVKKGTQDGIKEAGLEVLFEKTLVGNDHDNSGYWNGFYIALLKKPATKTPTPKAKKTSTKKK